MNLFKIHLNYLLPSLLERSLDIKVRDKNKRTNLGNIYFEDK
jgi:hypothetical protein